MIDLTPLDVRNKRGDFKKLLRGYDPQEVDVFLEFVAERLEELVRENMLLKDRSETLERQVGAQTGREQAVQEALVTAQELRSDIQAQAQREAEHAVHEAQTEARRLAAESESEARRITSEAEANARNLLRDAERKTEQAADALEEMERRRVRFLKAFRQLLERELDGVEVEEQRPPLDDRTVELDLGGGGLSGTTGDADANAAEDDEIPPDASVGELAAAYAWDTTGKSEGGRGGGEARADARPDETGPSDWLSAHPSSAEQRPPDAGSPDEGSPDAGSSLESSPDGGSPQERLPGLSPADLSPTGPSPGDLSPAGLGPAESLAAEEDEAPRFAFDFDADDSTESDRA